MTSAELSMTRIIRAPKDVVFNAWTKPEYLKQWWGPGKVFCPEAHIELKIGGQYRIANQLENGDVIWISGTFSEIDPPDKLVYDWSVGSQGEVPSLVTVTFITHDDGTELTITHTGIKDEALRDDHKKGWTGCLEKLEMLYAN